MIVSFSANDLGLSTCAVCDEAKDRSFPGTAILQLVSTLRDHRRRA